MLKKKKKVPMGGAKRVLAVPERANDFVSVRKYNGVRRCCAVLAWSGAMYHAMEHVHTCTVFEV